MINEVHSDDQFFHLWSKVFHSHDQNIILWTREVHSYGHHYSTWLLIHSMKSYDQWSWTITVHEIHIYMIFGDPSGQTFALILTVCHKVLLAISLAWDIRLKCTITSKIFSKEKLCDIRFLFQEAKIIIRTSRMATTAPPGSDNNVNFLSWLISGFQMFSDVFR